MIDRSKLFTRKGRLGEEHKQDDYAAWDALGDAAKFAAAWELVEEAYLLQGRKLDELRFQRSVTHIERRRV